MKKKVLAAKLNVRKLKFIEWYANSRKKKQWIIWLNLDFRARI